MIAETMQPGSQSPDVARRARLGAGMCLGLFNAARMAAGPDAIRGSDPYLT